MVGSVAVEGVGCWGWTDIKGYGTKSHLYDHVQSGWSLTKTKGAGRVKELGASAPMSAAPNDHYLVGPSDRITNPTIRILVTPICQADSGRTTAQFYYDIIITTTAG